MERLTPDAVQALMRDLPLWALESDGRVIGRTFVFADFKTAFAFMSQVAAEADRINHHPDWSNSYNRVTIRLTTHDASGLTERDMALARFCDKVSHK